MKYTQFIFIGIIAFLCCSCGTMISDIKIEIRQPASIPVSSAFRNALIVDNSPPFNDSIALIESRYPPLEVTMLMPDSAKSLVLSSLCEYMNEEGYFDTIKLYQHNTNPYNGMVTLSKEKIRQLCQENKADMLISFDVLTITGKEIVTNMVVPPKEYSSRFAAIINIYGKNGDSLQSPIVSPYYASILTNKTWNKIKHNVYEKSDPFSYYFRMWSDKMTRDFSPSWETDDRFLYYDQSEDMKNALKLTKEGKWQEAADIWIILYEKETNIEKKIQLASNLATANEFLDDIAYAYEWISTANNMLRDRHSEGLTNNTKWYRMKLLQRLNEAYELHEQIGSPIPDWKYN